MSERIYEDCTLLARWESRGGANWVDVTQDDDTGFCSYVSNSGGGTAGYAKERVVRRPGTVLSWIDPAQRNAEAEAAIRDVAAMVDRGYFLPGKAKLAMQRVV